MSKILAIVGLDFTKLIKDKKGFILFIAFPLIFTLIFGKAFGNSSTGLPVTVTDLDHSEFSKSIVAQLKDNKSLEVKMIDEKAAIDGVKNKDSLMAVIIPQEFGKGLRENKKVTLRLINVPNNNSAFALQEIVSGTVSRLEANANAANESVNLVAKQSTLSSTKIDELWQKTYAEADKKWSPEPPMTVSYSEMSGKGIVRKDFNNMTYYSIGFAIAFVMYTLTFGAGVILEDRANGTWGRLLATPTRPGFILTGHLIATFLQGWLQVAILILIGKYLFGVSWGSNAIALIIIMSAFLFAVTGLGLLLASFVRTHAQLQAVTPVVMASMAMIGGCYWPIDIVPKAMQTAAKFIPTGQAMQGLLDVVARGKDLADIQQPIYILLAMGIIFFAIGLKRVKFE